MTQMKSIIFILTLLFVSVYAHSEGIDSVYAEYCLNLESKNDTLVVELSLVKKNKGLKPISLSGTREPLVCGDYFFHPSIEFEFIDKSGKEMFSVSVGEGPQSAPIGLSGCADCPIKSKIGPIPVKRQPVIQLDLPESGKLMVLGNTKEDLLPFKNKFINAYTYVRIRCLPHLDTTYRTDFPVKITGECKQ